MIFNRFPLDGDTQAVSCLVALRDLLLGPTTDPVESLLFQKATNTHLYAVRSSIPFSSSSYRFWWENYILLKLVGGFKEAMRDFRPPTSKNASYSLSMLSYSPEANKFYRLVCGVVW